MARDVLHMVLQVSEVDRTPAPAVPGLDLRLLQVRDVEALGELLWEAYRDTIDDEYKEPDDARVDAARALAGRWGPLIEEASLAVTVDGRLIAAVVTVRDNAHNMIPLLAYVLTVSAWQRRGVAAWLVAESAVRLVALDVPEVHLAATREIPPNASTSGSGSAWSIDDRHGQAGLTSPTGVMLVLKQTLERNLKPTCLQGRGEGLPDGVQERGGCRSSRYERKELINGTPMACWVRIGDSVGDNHRIEPQIVRVAERGLHPKRRRDASNDELWPVRYGEVCG